MTDAVLEHCRGMIREGSKSFYAAARIFDPPTRESAYMLYAWCRYCDDRIDRQQLGRRGRRGDREAGGETLAQLAAETRRALAGEAVDAPVFVGLQRVVARHGIPRRYPLDLLAGFRMDAEGRRYEVLDDLLSYCYHVAGVVGVMMAYVMGVREEPTLDRATDLGLAFQLTNIARDVLDDARAGRVYLPRAWLAEAGVPAEELLEARHRAALTRVVQRLLAEADRYYASSRHGLPRLRLRHAWAIAAARRVYREIGRRIQRRGLEERAIIGGGRKMVLVLAAIVDALGSRFARRAPAPSRTDLWTRPRDTSPERRAQPGSSAAGRGL